MKKLIIILFALFTFSAIGQNVPQGINYQAVARDNAGVEISSTSIIVRFSIGGASVSNATFNYQETHNANTNQFGLFNTVIGQGSPSGGSGAFNGVTWSAPQYLLVEIDFGSGFEQMGVATPFVSVPYSLLAQDVVVKELPATATTNDILAWNGTNWVPVAPNAASETTTTMTDNGDGTFTYLNEIGASVTFDANIDDADANATNEIQDLTLSSNILTITNNGSATPIDLSIYSELPTPTGAGQVVVWNGSNWTAVLPSDPSPTNEIQDITITGNNLNISSGTGTTLASNTPGSVGQVLTWDGSSWIAQNPGTGADNWGSQTVVTDATLTGNGTSGSPLSGFDGDYTNLSNTPTIPTNTSDLTNDSGFLTSETDGSTTNELQNITIVGNAINISSGTGTNISTTAPSAGQVLTWNNISGAWEAQNPGSGADNWGSQTVVTDATLSGNGTAGSPLSGFDGDYGNLTSTPTIPTNTSDLINDSGFLTTEVDGSTTNEIQTLSVLGNNLTISGTGGNTVTLPSLTDTDDQFMDVFQLSGNNLALSLDNDGIATQTVDLTSIADKTIILTGSGATSISGAYPNFTISSTDNNTTYTAGTGINVSGGNVISNNAPDQVVSLTGLSGITVSGAYPNFSLTNTATGDTDWTQSAGIIYNTTDNVGIGTTNPSTSLHIEGAESSTVFNAFSGAPKSAVRIHNTDITNGNFSSLAFTTGLSNAANSEMAKIVGIYTNHTASSQAGELVFMTRNTSNLNEAMRIDENGNVGIGLINPFGRFDVTTSSNDRGSQIQNSTSSSNGKYGIYANASGAGTGDNNGGWFDAFGSGTGVNTGVGGQSLGTSGENRGVYGSAVGGTTNWAGYFEQGDVHIQNNVAIGSTTSDYGSTGAKTLTITDPAGYPHLEMNGYGAGTSSPAAYHDYYKFDGSTNNFIAREQIGSYGAHNTGYYQLSLGISGSFSNHISANNGKVGLGAIAYSSLNDVVHIYENDNSTDGENGAMVVIQNAAGSYSTASTNELAGIRFKVGSYVPNGMSKAGIFFQRDASYGRGDMIFALNSTAGLTNVNVSDEILRLSAGGTQDVIASNVPTTADAASFINSSTAGGTGVRGYVTTSGTSTGTRYGVYGAAWYGQSTNYGVYGYGFGGTTAYGIYGTASSATTNYAGYFSGNVHVNGALSKSSGTFKIDHPLDPENKYLYHSFVESPDMMNIYNGNIITDANGFATVELPEYFDALNKDFRYQLTVIGSFSQAIVSEKVSGNHFVIQTSVPNVEVSWQLTGVRKDAWAEAHPVIPEVDKESENKGKYLNPEVFGLPAEKGIDFENTKRDEKQK